MASQNTGISGTPNTYGAAIEVADTTALAALSPVGLTLGTTVYVVSPGAYYTMTGIGSGDVAVSGITNLYWVVQSSAAVTSIVAGTGITVSGATGAVTV